MKFVKLLVFWIAVLWSVPALFAIVKRQNPPVDGTAVSSEQRQLELGKAHYYGKWASDVAVSKLLPLAMDGNAEAQYYIGLMHDSDGDIPLGAKEINNAFGVYNYLEAVKWYRLSAEQGFVPAQADLGRMYHYGHGVNEDSVQALMWLTLATTTIPKSATASVVHSNFRDFLRSEMTLAQITEAQRLAQDWLAKHPVR